jgi:hypothetical protein
MSSRSVAQNPGAPKSFSPLCPSPDYRFRPPLCAVRRRLRVRAAFRAELRRLADPRLLAARRAWLDSADREAVLWLSRRRALDTARDRLADLPVRPRRPRLRSRAACLLVRADPRRGGGSFMPARRAFERPMAMACSGDLAPCWPSRTCSISSRTNSPAWVDGALPSRASCFALSIAGSSGITILSLCGIGAGRTASYDHAAFL